MSLRNVRHADAIERQAVRNERSPMEQLKELDRRLGKGKGAKKERTKLNNLLDGGTK